MTFGRFIKPKIYSGHNGPPPCINVIPDPVWNRVERSGHISGWLQNVFTCCWCLIFHQTSAIKSLTFNTHLRCLESENKYTCGVSGFQQILQRFTDCQGSAHFTVVTFLMCLGQKWDLVEIISHSLYNIIKCTMTRYYKQKYLRFSSKNTSKIMKKRFFGSNRVWTGDLEIMKPAC